MPDSQGRTGKEKSPGSEHRVETRSQRTGTTGVITIIIITRTAITVVSGSGRVTAGTATTTIATTRSTTLASRITIIIIITRACTNEQQD